MNLRSYINLIERATMMHIPSGWQQIDGSPIYVDLKVWENPLQVELHRAIHECFVMDGEPNLRGLAHGGKVWVWSAQKATHDGLLIGLGLWDSQTQGTMVYSHPDFTFFQVWGSHWMENDDNPIVVSYAHHDNALRTTVATRWKATMVHGGSWMADTTR
jgi:hypothetical protein